MTISEDHPALRKFRSTMNQIYNKAVTSAGGFDTLHRLTKVLELCLVAHTDKRLRSADRHLLMQLGLLNLLHDGCVTEQQLADTMGVERKIIKYAVSKGPLVTFGYLHAAHDD